LACTCAMDLIIKTLSQIVTMLYCRHCDHLHLHRQACPVLANISADTVDSPDAVDREQPGPVGLRQLPSCPRGRRDARCVATII
jgi:hypothetical protein